jgi:predicted aconitase
VSETRPVAYGASQPVPASLELTADEERMLRGQHGDAARAALEMQIQVGAFFGARRLVPVTNVHMMGDMEVMGTAGYQFLEKIAGLGGRCAVPTTTNARCVDFAAADRLRQSPELVENEARLIGLLRQIGVMTVDTCINYQSVYQPHFHEHVAWGDTGAAAYANSVLGARTNYESGPAALAAGLTGRTPQYGFHLDGQRLGTVHARIRASLHDASDWGALGAVVGRRITDYWTVPVLELRSDRRPTPDDLKHLSASLASYGSLAMFHLVGETPEAPTLSAALGDRAPQAAFDVGDDDIEAVYAGYPPERETVSLVVLTAPQLSLFELRRVAELLGDRSVHPGTHLLVTTNALNKMAGDRLGYTATIERAGGLVLTGTCWYLMAPDKMRDAFGWTQVVTNSAKLANIIGGYRYRAVLRPTAACIDAAITGRLAR